MNKLLRDWLREQVRALNGLMRPLYRAGGRCTAVKAAFLTVHASMVVRCYCTCEYCCACVCRDYWCRDQLCEPLNTSTVP